MPSSALIEKLHAEIVVGCQAGACQEVFVSAESPKEPIEAWSMRATIEAENRGWSVSPAGLVLCPKHGSRTQHEAEPMGANEVTTLRIGEEHDLALLSRLRAAVAGLGGSMTESFWGVGGSQEVTKYEISLPDGVIEAEAETYIGLSLRGPAQLVQQVALAVQRA